MSIDFFVELIWGGGGGGRTLNRTLGLKKICLQNLLGMFKVLKFVGIRVWFVVVVELVEFVEFECQEKVVIALEKSSQSW